MEPKQDFQQLPPQGLELLPGQPRMETLPPAVPKISPGLVLASAPKQVRRVDLSLRTLEASQD
jgi:hypothetical protein